MPRDAAYLLVAYVPVTHTNAVLDAVFAAGAGVIGDYEACAFVSRGIGQFRPRRDALPVIGQFDQLERVDEDRIEVVVPVPVAQAVVAAVRTAHPYEEPVWHLLAPAGIETVGSDRE